MASVNRIIQKSSFKSIHSLRAICFNRKLSSDQPGSHSCRIKQEAKIHRRLYSTDKHNMTKVLSQSTILVQDGIDIEELPILIRRATQDSFPFSSHTYSGEKIAEESEFDSSFCEMLQDCKSVGDVFKLLEVPSDKVRGYSAAYALQRLHVLKYLNTNWNQIHSFIRTAVMRELYDTVQRDVKQLSNGTLLSLVECYLAAEGFSMSCIDAVNTEIQCRLGEVSFTVEELLTLANILKSSKSPVSYHPQYVMGPKTSTMTIVSENASRFLSNDEDEFKPTKIEHFDRFSAKVSPQVREEIKMKCTELLNHVWIHLNSRYPEINGQTLPLTLESLTSDKKNMVTLLEKSISRCWTELSPEGAATCLDNLVRLRVYSSSFMTHLGRWAYVNLHQVTPQLMLSYLNAFIQFDFTDENLIRVMERCLQLKGAVTHTSVLAMCVEYCRSCRYLSPVIMDAAASHFTQYGKNYEPLQLYAVLRAFGELNYLPAESSTFLRKVESCLWERFDDIEEAHLLEILGSFTFLNVLPKNFFKRVASTYFYGKVGKLKNPQRSMALMWIKVLKQAVAMDLSRDMEKNFHWVLQRRTKWSVFLYLDSHKVAVQAVKSAFDNLFGARYHHVLPFYGCCAMYLDKDGVPLEITRNLSGQPSPQGNIAKKLVVLLRSSEHFTVNTKQLLGAQAQRKKHLIQLGFTPVEVRSSEFAFTDKSSSLLSDYLSPYVNIEKASNVCIKDSVGSNYEPEEDPIRLWLGYDEKEDFSSDDEGDTMASLMSSLKDSDKSVSVEDSGLISDSQKDGKTSDGHDDPKKS